MSFFDGKEPLPKIPSRKPSAGDWVRLDEDTEYSKYLNLYWHKQRAYDELSAKHNGIIGTGRLLKQIIKENLCKN